MFRSRSLKDPGAAGPVLIGCLVATLAFEGCAAAPAPVLPALRQLQPKTPVIYVPGSTGTKLRDRATGQLVWGEGRQLLVPHDGGYAIARPLHLPPSSEQSRLEPTEAIREIRLAVFSQDVYGPIAELLEANGYRFGDLEHPDSGDTAFLFAYDWRLDHRLAAKELLERLEALRQARGEERLEVDLVCQSNGAYICRYLLKYGGATLEDAESGRASPPERVGARKVILLGNSNGGSLRMLREIHRGRGYIAWIGRKMRPEVLFSAPALIQDLPVVRQDLFLDQDGEPLEVDLFDAETWRRYGWSIFARETRERIAERDPDRDLFGDQEQQLEYLRRALDYARRFHQVLARDVEGFGATRYYMLQGKSEETPDRAILRQRKRGWELLFTGDRKLRKLGKLHEMATAEGDGHATVASQMWLSPQEKEAMAAEPFYIEDNHFDLILRTETHRRLLEYLHDGDAR